MEATQLSQGSIVVGGAMGQKPRHGGHSWVLLQYMLGFKKLGWDVLFLDRLVDDCAEVPHEFVRIMRHFGLGDQYAVLRHGSPETVGVSRNQVLERVKSAALLLNVMGFIDDEEVLGAATKRVFLDIDPGFPQMWTALGLYNAFDAHNFFVTVGLNIGKPECLIPTCGVTWITTLQPIVLDLWPCAAVDNSDRFTSIVTWRGANGPVEYDGRTYGLRVHEFRKFAQLPSISGHHFELALDIHPSEVNDLDLLRSNGWSLVDPIDVACDPWTYQAYIQSSGSEFMVAKHMYVATNSGWFSDRSMCYLASGKPVLAQGTGFRTGLAASCKGLLTFETLEDARGGVEDIVGDYAAHAKAARRLAEDHFDSDLVLRKLLSQLGVG